MLPTCIGKRQKDIDTIEICVTLHTKQLGHLFIKWCCQKGFSVDATLMTSAIITIQMPL